MDATVIVVLLVLAVGGIYWYRKRDNKKGRTGTGSGGGDGPRSPNDQL